MAVGYLADAFDLINVRDLDLIAQARTLCSRLVVGVYTDDYAESLNGRRPVVPYEERRVLVSHIRGVDEVIEHDGVGPHGDHHRGVERRLFVGSDRPARAEDGAAVLTVRRRTSSQILSEALEPVRAQAVA